MKIVIYISFLLPLLSCSQSKYDTKQDAKINKSISDITAISASITTINLTITKLIADTTLKGKRISDLEKRVKTLEDSVAIYKGYLAQGDFLIDKNKVITVPMLQRIPLIEGRVTKLEGKQ